jgi:hypothetical protein
LLFHLLEVVSASLADTNNGLPADTQDFFSSSVHPDSRPPTEGYL